MCFSGTISSMSTMAISHFLLFSLFPAFFPCLFALSETASISENHCVEDLQSIKLKIADLETKLEDVIRNLDKKGLYIEEQEKVIYQLSQKIQILQSSVLDLKTNSLSANEKLKALEQEVQLLWAALRKNNFDIHLLKSKSQETDDKLVTVSSQAEKMSSIVTEQWIQLQRLEQALHMTQMMALRARRKVDYSRCPFLRFIDKVFENVRGIMDPYIIQFKRVLTWTKDYHHQLQRFIRREMEKNEFTAALANEEFVFFVASALVTFPVLEKDLFHCDIYHVLSFHMAYLGYDYGSGST